MGLEIFRKGVSGQYSRILHDILDESRKEIIKKNCMSFSEKVDQKLALDECIKKKILQQLLTFNKISILYWMRNLSCTEERAKHYIISATQHECCDCGNRSINYFDKAFRDCTCFTKSES